MIDLDAIPRLLQLLNDEEEVTWQAMGAVRNLAINRTTLILFSFISFAYPLITAAGQEALLKENGLQRFREALAADAKKSTRVKLLIVNTLVIITSKYSIISISLFISIF